MCDFILLPAFYFIIHFPFLMTRPPNGAPSVSPVCFSVICPLTPSELATVLESTQSRQTPTASPASSHTPINLCIDSSLHFHTVWAELKQDDSLRSVHCFPRAPAVYTEIGVLQTTSAQLRNWMY